MRGQGADGPETHNSLLLLSERLRALVVALWPFACSGTAKQTSGPKELGTLAVTCTRPCARLIHTRRSLVVAQNFASSQAGASLATTTSEIESRQLAGQRLAMNMDQRDDATMSLVNVNLHTNWARIWASAGSR